MSTDFLIVGGGIGGAVLAQLLGRAGKRVVVLERDAVGARPLPRPEVLWPATVRTIRPLLPRGTADATLLPVRGITFVRRRRRVGFRMPPGGGSNPAAGACFTDPALTDPNCKNPRLEFTYSVVPDASQPAAQPAVYRKLQFDATTNFYMQAGERIRSYNLLSPDGN